MVKSLPANAGDVGLISRSGRSPGGGNGNPLQYSCLENPMDRGAWGAVVHGVAELDMTEMAENTSHLLFSRPVLFNSVNTNLTRQSQFKLIRNFF